MDDKSEGKPISQGPNRHNNDSDVANSSNDKSSDAVPTAVDVTQTIKNSQSAEKKAPKRYRDSHDWWHLGLLGGTLLVAAIATVAAIYAAIYTAQEVEVARDALKEVRGATQKELRAYVFVKPYAWVNNVTENSMFNSTVGIRNGGQTPASELSLNFNIEARGAPPENTRPAFAATIRRSVETVLDPSTALSGIGTINSEKPLTSKEFAAVINDQGMRLYVWGTVTYKDVFDKMHHSYFCFFYFGRQPNRRDKGFGARRQGSCPHPNPN